MRERKRERKTKRETERMRETKGKKTFPPGRGREAGQ